MPNPTQFTGLISFAVAAVFCLLPPAKEVAPRERRLWVAIGFSYMGLGLEVWLSGRHILGEMVRGLLRQQQIYADRSYIQMAILAFAAALFLTSALWVLQLSKVFTWRASFAVLGLVVVCPIFLVELVSLHGTDRWLYLNVEGILLIGYLWAFGAAITAIAAATKWSTS
jgi:hypothetical protein